MYEPKWTITNKILWSVGKIEAALEVLEMGTMTADWEMKFREDALIRSVSALSKMEGHIVNRGEVEKLIRVEASRDERSEEVALRAGVVAKEREIQSILNKQSAFKYVEQIVRLSEKTGVGDLGERELMQINSLLLEKIWPSHSLGVYRLAGVDDKDFFSSCVKVPPLSIEVPYQMEDFWLWFKSASKEKHYPVIMAALTAIELARVLPFSGSNGSTITLFAELLMGINGRGFKRTISLSDMWMSRSSEFNHALGETIKEGENVTEWVEFFCDAFSSECEGLKVKIKRLGGGNIPKTKWGKQVALTERQIMLMESFQTRGELTMTETRNILPMVSEDTILRDLAGLMVKKLIKKKGKTKGAKYVLTRAIL